MTPKPDERRDERRFAVGTVEYRAEPDTTVAGPGVATGYAAMFGRRSADLGGFTELIDPAAFTKTVAEADVVGLWNHNEDRLLGRLSSGTLRLKVDERGLNYEIDLPDTTTGRDLAVSLARGDVRGSSFGFRTIRDKWDQDDAGVITRTLLEVALIDVSPVTRPAYPDTSAAMRSLASHTHHDLAEVRAAVEARDLAPLLTPPGAETPPPPVEEDAPVADPPIGWLWA